ncbi:hypothetical protein ACRS7F_24500 [Brucella anthropi]|uniref:hypothetical protein n=1 Tax=Brucella anthropi TaxID=529 RepID=UPI00124E631F|nr:hypothetical protein [Brucella anthropi]KAB2785439.1 hypothetical protein F9K96_23545 [Brucella anthropi]QOD66998.1 hypothetical protein HGK82_23975 [Ochrobactrum sp. MT180101]
MDNASLGKVGIFWLVQWQGRIRFLSASCPIEEGEPYGEMVTYGTGHYTTWDRWQKSRNMPLERGIANAFEYEEWPRGRISFCRNTRKYLLLCDRKIMRDDLITDILAKFSIPKDEVTIDGDPHYRSVENLA